MNPVLTFHSLSAFSHLLAAADEENASALWPILSWLAIFAVAIITLAVLWRTLVIKNMRQRALGTALTLLSVLLGVALAISILLVSSGAGALLGQEDYGYNVNVGVDHGSPI